MALRWKAEAAGTADIGAGAVGAVLLGLGAAAVARRRTAPDGA